MYKETIEKFSKDALNACGTEELNVFKNIALKKAKEIAGEQHREVAKKYETILQRQIDMSEMRIEEERRRLDNFKAEIAEMVNGEASEIERRKNAAYVEIAKITDKVYRDLKGGNQ